MTKIQNFNIQGGPEYGQRNLAILRKQLAKLSIDGFIIPHEDEYQNEYLPDCNERLMWVSGFTGSAGASIVTQDKAAMFVDGRYTLQVRTQVDGELFSYERLEDNGMGKWLRTHVKNGDVIGYDPKLHSPKALSRLKNAVHSAGGTLKALSQNPIDQSWIDRPPAPTAPLSVQPLSMAGEAHRDKIDRMANDIDHAGADAAVITAPASIAWLLNIRGGDVMCTPLPLSTVILTKDGAVNFYVNQVKLSAELRVHLGNQVAILDEDDLQNGLKDLSGQCVMLDPGTTSAWFFDELKSVHAKVIHKMDPVAIPKACKNPTEIAGTTEAHKRDGAALVRFLHWLDTDAQSGHYDEIAAASKLESFRHATGALKDLSFMSISGAGSNGAIVHYRVSEATTKPLEKGSLFLIDSGGQYQDGTTDVTRTIPIGTPSAEMRERFTLVLKGHIAMANVRFPEGTTGSNLDVLARHALWQAGFDYDHGTGHGVGVYLGVHEGPQRISKAPNSIALRPGMIVSNEPGYYKTDGYGIRIENLQYVTAPTPIKGGERPMLGFQNLTWAPLHKALIDTSLLSQTEIGWVNDYHAKVWDYIGVRLGGADDAPVKDWLQEACRAL